MCGLCSYMWYAHTHVYVYICGLQNRYNFFTIGIMMGVASIMMGVASIIVDDLIVVPNM